MDNFYHNCPAQMSDGRHVADYTTSTRRNEHIKYINNIYCNDKYRMFLQQNGAKLADNVFNHYEKTQTCWENPCVHIQKETKVTPTDMSNELKRYNQRAINNYKASTQTTGCVFYEDYRLNK